MRMVRKMWAIENEKMMGNDAEVTARMGRALNLMGKKVMSRVVFYDHLLVSREINVDEKRTRLDAAHEV